MAERSLRTAIQPWLATKPFAFGCAVLASGIAGAVLFARFHSGPTDGHVIFSDMLDYYYPMTERVSGRLASGQWPLWNPSICAGIPLLATMQVGALYPGIWLSVWLGPQQGMYWLLAIECGLGAALACWACRSGGRGPGACAFAGLIFAFGCLVGGTWYPSTTATLCWMPGLIVGIEKLSRRSWVAGWSLLALFTALQCLGGFPQYLVYSLLFAGAYAGVRVGSAWFQLGLREGLRPTFVRCALISSAVVVGVGISAAQLLPGLELVTQSARFDPLSPAEIGYMKPTSLALFFKNAVNPEPKLIILEKFDGGYLGIATLVLAALGAVARWRRPETWLLLGAGVLSLILSGGYNSGIGGLYSAFAEIPFVGSFRTPERLRFVWFFCVLMLASDGFAAFADGYRRLREQRLTAAFSFAAALAVLIAVIARNADGALERVAACTLLLAVAWPLANRRSARVALQAAMLALVFADLFFAIDPRGMLPLPDKMISGAYQPKSGHRIRNAKLAELRREAENYRVELTGFIPHLGVGDANQLHKIACLEPLMPAAWQGLMRTLKPRAVPGLGGRLGWKRFPTLHEVASVRYSVGQRQARITRTDTNPDALPRAYLVEQFEIVDQQTAFERIRDGDFDFWSGVMLERAPEAAGWQPPANPVRARPARIENYQDEFVEIQASNEEHALLVLTDGFFPGWVARIDDEPTEILRANGVFRAIHLTPGDHRVTFRYEPRSFAWGLRISFASLVLWGCVWIGWPAVRRRAVHRRAVHRRKAKQATA
jgi:hypothetical protein